MAGSALESKRSKGSAGSLDSVVRETVSSHSLPVLDAHEGAGDKVLEGGSRDGEIDADFCGKAKEKPTEDGNCVEREKNSREVDKIGSFPCGAHALDGGVLDGGFEIVHEARAG